MNGARLPVRNVCCWIAVAINLKFIIDDSNGRTASASTGVPALFRSEIRMGRGQGGRETFALGELFALLSGRENIKQSLRSCAGERSSLSGESVKSTSQKIELAGIAPIAFSDERRLHTTACNVSPVIATNCFQPLAARPARNRLNSSMGAPARGLSEITRNPGTWSAKCVLRFSERRSSYSLTKQRYSSFVDNDDSNHYGHASSRISSPQF